MQTTDNKIIVNSSGVRTSDLRGHKYYRGTAQLSIAMTLKYFHDAQTFWADQQLNGAPLALVEVEILTAANNFIPYNTINEKSIMPIESKSPMENRAVWYNVTFNADSQDVKTGWMCGNLYSSANNASVNAASDVMYSLVNTPLVRSSVMRTLEANFGTKTR